MRGGLAMIIMGIIFLTLGLIFVCDSCRAAASPGQMSHPQHNLLLLVRLPWKVLSCKAKCEAIEVQVDNSADISFQARMNPQSELKGIIDMRRSWAKELQDAQEVKTVTVGI